LRAYVRILSIFLDFPLTRKVLLSFSALFGVLPRYNDSCCNQLQHLRALRGYEFVGQEAIGYNGRSLYGLFCVWVWLFGGMRVKNWPLPGCSDTTVFEVAYVTMYPWELEHFLRSEKKRGSFHKISGTLSSFPAFLNRLVRFTYWTVSRLGESVVVTTGKVKRSFGNVPGCVSVTENRRNADELRLFDVFRLPSLDHKVPTLAEAGALNQNTLKGDADLRLSSSKMLPGKAFGVRFRRC
jgi:hypothetical protein